ncbi:hypothetical protein HOY80DRAFT_1050136 [Tuber brumale]|nr:hypothetical protein HOY80DRAFT_1050136 [Tuber brumale]
MSFTAINSVAGGAKKDTNRGGGKEAKESEKMTAKDQVKELSSEKEKEKDMLEKEAYIKFLSGKYDVLDSELTLSLKKSTSYLLLRHMVIRKFIKEYDPDEKGKQFQTFCCHCDKCWGPYDMHNTTTSYLIRHFSIDHPDLPRSYPEEDALLRRMKKGIVEDVIDPKDAKDAKDTKDTKGKGKKKGGKSKADGLEETKAGEEGAKGRGREQEGKNEQANARKTVKNKRGRAIAELETPIQLKAAEANTLSTKSKNDEALASLRKTRSGKRTGQPENISAAGINLDSPDPLTTRKRRRTEPSVVTNHKNKTPSVEKFLAEADHTLSTLLPLENDSTSLPPPPPVQESAAAATLPAPSSSAVTLLAPSSSTATLPAPSSSATTLPAPSSSATTLPAPSSSATSLPAPSSSAAPFVPATIDSTIPQTPFTQSYKNLLTEFLASSETSPSVIETKEFHDLVNFLNPETPKFNFNSLIDRVFVRQKEIRTDKREKPDGSVRTKKFEDSLKKEKERRRKKEEGYRAWLFRD